MVLDGDERLAATSLSARAAFGERIREAPQWIPESFVHGNTYCAEFSYNAF